MTQTERDAKELKSLRSNLNKQVSELARLNFAESMTEKKRVFGFQFDIHTTHVELRVFNEETCNTVDTVSIWCLDAIFCPYSFHTPLEKVRENVNDAVLKFKEMKALFLKYKKLNNNSK